MDTHNWQAEQSWRTAFRRLANHILDLEVERRKYAQEYAAGHGVRGTLEEIDRRLKRAREQLADLERERR
ncbi:hypothetical protein [Archangium sp.]|uniref:hypothetical protein n=1 Tax=Archangium sp. TaxID=1872627 RepID=UPI002D39676B|nr:hypothetical protein [Archangium sp.]HYO56402.1 hypothetical protein [Archangium sp.]